MKRDTLSAARRLQLQVEEQWSHRRGKKDSVLHLRIETEIVDRVKAEAKARNISVADYVRMRLVEGFSAVVDTPGQTPDFLLATSAWTEAVVMQESVCPVCGETLERGSKAWLATGPPPPPRIVCADCYESVLTGNAEEYATSEGDA